MNSFLFIIIIQMSNKKIDINPNLFNIGGSLKTRKKREKKQKSTTLVYA